MMRWRGGLLTGKDRAREKERERGVELMQRHAGDVVCPLLLPLPQAKKEEELVSAGDLQTE